MVWGTNPKDAGTNLLFGPETPLPSQSNLFDFHEVLVENWSNNTCMLPSLPSEEVTATI